MNGIGRGLIGAVAIEPFLRLLVEQCVAGRVRTWAFPKPKGGGGVQLLVRHTA